MVQRKEQQEVYRENGRPCGNQRGNQKRHLLIYAHSNSRYYCAEKVHFSGVEDGRAGNGDGGK